MEATAQTLSAVSLPLFEGSELVKAITIPLFTGAIGYVINWTGVWMLFYPVRFAGFRLPGLAPLVTLLPRRGPQGPRLLPRAGGWAGGIPSRGPQKGSVPRRKGGGQPGGPPRGFPPAPPGAV